jgi:hypothetical protein
VIRDALLALGILLAPATQLRLGDTPLGPGELCLAVWLSVSICRQVTQPGLFWNAALTRLGIFWLILIIAECIGVVVGFTTELFFDTPSIIHDIIAYGLMIAVGCVMAVELASEPRRRRVTWMIVSVGASSLTLQMAGANGWIGLPIDSMVDPWFFDRLRGWSKDPNQLGFCAASLTLLSIHAAETAVKRTAILAAIVCAGIAFSVGLLTKSDSYIVCILAAGSVVVAVKSLAWLRTLESGLTLRAASVCIALLAFPMLVVAAVPFAPAALEHTEAYSTEVYNEDNQGDARLDLWREALAKGLDAGMLGLGPGPHLTSKAYKRPPPDKFEAHNTPLDLFTQGGLLAVLALAYLYGSTLLMTFRAKLPALMALAFAFVVFSMFHFVVRHPIFWFGVVLCLLEAASVPKPCFDARHAHSVAPIPKATKRT